MPRIVILNASTVLTDAKALVVVAPQQKQIIDFLKVSQKFSVIFLALGLFVAQPVFADDDAPKQNTKVTIDLADPDLGDQTRNAVMDYVTARAQDKVKHEIAAPTPDKVQKWAMIGKGIGDAIAAAAHSLNVGINEFIKTPAGQLTVWAILMYLFGHTLWTVVAGITIWIIVGGLIYGSFRKFHMPHKLKNADGGQHLESYNWASKEAKITSACFHVAFFMLLSIICVIEIL